MRRDLILALGGFINCIGVIGMKFSVRIITIVLLLLTSACSSTYTLRNPVPLEGVPEQVSASVTYHVPSTAKNFSYKGNLNIQSLVVEFGPSLENTIRDALSLQFSNVSPQSSNAEEPDTPLMTTEFGLVSVSPGALTFSSSSARVELIVNFQRGGRSQSITKQFIGEATVEPGVAGALPIPGLNDSAYNAALRRACELALSRAVEKAVDGFASFLTHSTDAPEVAQHVTAADH